MAAALIDAAAAAGTTRRERKGRYIQKLQKLLGEYQNIIIVQCDNVGSNQMQKVRIALRGQAVLLMGKNTIIRKIVREQVDNNPKLETLLPYIYGNIGLVFTNADLKHVRKVIQENKVPAAAKVGTLAPSHVFVPPGPTGLDPGQTNFFQALNIPTKIVKGAIEIINEVHLIRAGEKVSASHVALLTKLHSMPFFYGFKVTDVYENGTMYASEVLDLTEDDLRAKFSNALRRMAAVSLAIGQPNAVSVPHIIANAFKKMLSISLVTDIELEQSKKFKEYLADPSKFAVAAAPASAAAAAPSAGNVETKKESSESEGDMGFSLFD
jgi:large subunit ribosomal protein LP0